MKHYEAPWSKSLIVISVLTSMICLGVSSGAWWAAVAKHQPDPVSWVALLPLVILFCTALFTIRDIGYRFEDAKA